MRGRRATAASCLLALVAGLVPFIIASPAGAVSAPTVVATGLNNPYKLAFGPDGDLYVAEAGTGGSGPCVEGEGEEGPTTLCLGTTGSVTRIDDGTGTQSRVVTGLPSIAEKDSEGDGAIGPTSVSVGSDGTIDVIVGLGGDLETRSAYGAGAAGLATIMRAAPGSTTATVFADLLAFEAANDPDKVYGEELTEGIDSNPFDILRTTDGLVAIDAGGNDLLSVSNAGNVSLVTLFPLADPAELPPFIPAPPGTKIPPQPVPTGIVQAANGDLFVSELTGFPFPKGGSRVHEVTGNANTVAHTGFTNAIDIAADAAGNLYVLEFASNGIFAGDGHSQLVQVRTDGTRKVLLSSELLLPSGVTVGPDGMVYVTNGSLLAGAGTVIRVDPRVARDAATAAACDPVKVKGSGFTDVARSVHQESVECLKWWGLVNGLSATSFAPNRNVTRGEVASLVARLLERAGRPMPSDPPAAFSDTTSGTHALRINQLAALGLVNGFGDGTYRPDRPISRGEVASLMVRSWKHATGEDLPAGTDKFTDDETSTHEASINAAAAIGWVAGKTPTTFGPNDVTQRGQGASFTARMLSSLVTKLGVTLPT